LKLFVLEPFKHDKLLALNGLLFLQVVDINAALYIAEYVTNSL
jgi:hypothetical protein